MRFSFVLALATAFGNLCLAQVTPGHPFPRSEVYVLKPKSRILQPMNTEFSGLYNMIHEHLGHLSPDYLDKRDAFQDNLENLLVAFNRSGLLLQIIDQISNSPQQMDTIANYLLQLLTSFAGGSNSTSALNTSVVSTTVKNLTSEIIQSTVEELLFVDLQLIDLANSLGSLLVNQSWIAGVINFIGVHGWISIPQIFDLAQNYKSKDPNFNGTRYSVYKRDDASNSSYSGSFQSFLNNLIGSATQSEFASASIASILGAINDSGIVPSVTQQLVGDQNFYTMIGYIATKLYNYGVLDAIDLETIVKQQRDSGKMAATLNYALGDPLLSPRIARIFYQLKNNGALKQLRLNFLGKS